MSVIFTWDLQKANRNRRKHGITFEEASSTFYDLLPLTIDDPMHSNEEDRLLIIGTSIQRRLRVVIHADEGDVIRIFSARRAEPYKRKQYEDGYYDGT